MLIFHDPPLVLFAVPKTGTTALEAALAKRADVTVGGSAQAKHCNVSGFERDIEPKHCKPGFGYLRLCAIRDPLDRLRSWYRYRLLPQFDGSATSTRDMTFEDFIRDQLDPSGGRLPKIGNQRRFVSRKDGSIGMHRMYAYPNLAQMVDDLADILGPIDLPRQNVSPKATTDLSPSTLDALKEARAPEFELYERVSETGMLDVDFD
ncbi:sulfotransferase family 2 domain-containing protein [Shimia ponticola]|uniref:sulfotransferase family 2 domain-containing protein n=1 Tax=Shimia ponticola TaxID=2582893 RepID=UPI0011BD7807|nr:sulfotransferase family 2 domain-containing protein [Shimia ponticola]